MTSNAGRKIPNWMNVARIVWCSGGVVAMSQPGPNVEITAGVMGSRLSSLAIPTYGALFNSLTQRGLRIVGVMFVQDKDEVEQLYPANFRAAALSGGWKVWNLKEKWDQVTFAASKAGNADLMDVTARLAAGYKHSEMRLLDLADAYSTQLRAYVQRGDVKEYQLFSDKNSDRVYKAIHALFWELAVLRDVLAEFAAKFSFGITQVRRFTRLLSKLRGVPVPDSLALNILRAGEPGAGWIWLFSQYRDFFTHSAPLQQVSNAGYTIQDMRQLAADLRVPQIYYPLPGDISHLSENRSRRAHFDSLEDLTKTLSTGRNRSTDPDALEYLHCCLDQFADLGNLLLPQSPIAPVPITLRAEDIINFTVVSNGSKITHNG